MKYRVYSNIKKAYIQTKIAMTPNGEILRMSDRKPLGSSQDYVIEEQTPYFDKDNKQLFVGDVIRHYTDFNLEYHGSYVDYVIVKRNGVFISEYLRSEKGQVLPVGYTAGIIIDNLCEEYDNSSLVFYDNPDLMVLPTSILIGNIHEN